jgi:predicted DNA-binding antitoxin AbrB/MazE fold protein
MRLEFRMDTIRVKYEDGVFKPLEKLRKLKEGAIGEVQVDEAQVEKTRKRPSVRSSEFFGLWKNRKDINGGLSYVRNLRSKSRYWRCLVFFDTVAR